MSIYIFSRPIHSGKTTGLLQWCNEQKNVHGILMPDTGGSRKIMNIKTKEVFAIECTDAENAKEPLITVGRFHFYSAAFEKANAILLQALAQKPDPIAIGWLIIDEAGKLELDGKGFYDAIKKIIDVYNDKKSDGNLLITVRDSLCEEVISFFKIKNCTVIHQLEELGLGIQKKSP